MGAYVDALGRFKLMARNLYGGDANAPDISAGYAAAMLRYLKDRAAKLKSSPCEPWKLVGEPIARTPFAAKLDADARDRLWSWARCVCQAADEQGLAFAAVHPDPATDYALLRKAFGASTREVLTTDGAPSTQNPDEDRDAATDQQNLDQAGADPAPGDVYEDPDAEATWGKKPKTPTKTTGDQINLGLFLIAVIVIGTVFHRVK